MGSKSKIQCTDDTGFITHYKPVSGQGVVSLNQAVLEHKAGSL